MYGSLLSFFDFFIRIPFNKKGGEGNPRKRDPQPKVTPPPYETHACLANVQALAFVPISSPGQNYCEAFGDLGKSQDERTLRALASTFFCFAFAGIQPCSIFDKVDWQIPVSCESKI
jgi:hypothetical protein